MGVLTASCSLRELDFARSVGSLRDRRFRGEAACGSPPGNQCSDRDRPTHPSASGPGVLVWTGRSAATASRLAAEGAGEGGAGSLELELELPSEPLSLENFT